MPLSVRAGVVLALAVAVRGSAALTRAPGLRGIMDGIVTDSSRFRIIALPAGEYVVMARLWSTRTPKQIGGVEIYSGPATVPLEYKRANTVRRHPDLDEGRTLARPT